MIDGVDARPRKNFEQLIQEGGLSSHVVHDNNVPEWTAPRLIKEWFAPGVAGERIFRGNDVADTEGAKAAKTGGGAEGEGHSVPIQADRARLVRMHAAQSGYKKHPPTYCPHPCAFKECESWTQRIGMLLNSPFFMVTHVCPGAHRQRTRCHPNLGITVTVSLTAGEIDLHSHRFPSYQNGTSINA